MKRAVLVSLLVLLSAVACSEDGAKPVSEPGEKLYTVRGKILGRDAEDNTVRMDHEPIPGFMEAMIMDYSVRGTEVAKLPADGNRIEARLHVTDRSYWITNVKQIP